MCSSALSAAPDCRLARDSKYRPASRKVVTAAATSRYRWGSELVEISSKGIFTPGMPAWVKNSAHTDQAYAAITPSEIRVSIVAAPCRRLVQAARWNGQAPHTTTGEASVNASHCQLLNCRAGIIDSSTTGTASAAEISRRWRHGADSSGALPSVSADSAAASDPVSAGSAAV